MSDPLRHHVTTPESFGVRGAIVVPANGTDLDPVAKTVEVTSTVGGADLQILPVGNADGEWITVTGVFVGYRPPWRVRRVGTATTCTVASVL